MKKSILSIALLALMTTGLAYADTTTSNTATHGGDRWAVNCSFGSTGCSAEARIVLAKDALTNESVSPNWFGTLLAVSCPGAGGLISASDAVLYRLTGDPHFNWDLDNADATVHVLFQDHPFHDHGPNNVNAELRIDHGSDTGSCTFTRLP